MPGENNLVGKTDSVRLRRSKRVHTTVDSEEVVAEAEVEVGVDKYIAEFETAEKMLLVWAGFKTDDYVMHDVNGRIVGARSALAPASSNDYQEQEVAHLMQYLENKIKRILKEASSIAQRLAVFDNNPIFIRTKSTFVPQPSEEITFQDFVKKKFVSKINGPAYDVFLQDLRKKHVDRQYQKCLKLLKNMLKLEQLEILLTRALLEKEQERRELAGRLQEKLPRLIDGVNERLKLVLQRLDALLTANPGMHDVLKLEFNASFTFDDKSFLEIVHRMSGFDFTGIEQYLSQEGVQMFRKLQEAAKKCFYCEELHSYLINPINIARFQEGEAATARSLPDLDVSALMLQEEQQPETVARNQTVLTTPGVDFFAQAAGELEAAVRALPGGGNSDAESAEPQAPASDFWEAESDILSGAVNSHIDETLNFS
jgi:hypothetical protein